MSEIQIYNLVKSAYERAESMGIKIEWWSDGWVVLGVGDQILHVVGHTAEELHHYLNGFADGRAHQRRNAK